MIRSIAVAALALACNYGASFRDCTIMCSDVSGCPSGFSCVATFCRAAGATTACASGGDPGNDGAIGDGTTSTPDGEQCPGDLDCDGVPDGSDNCPTVANPGQENEDGDRFGDVCDPCPPFVDADPVIDTDGDGVSDQCDPRLTTPGDKIVAFEGFAHGVPPTWNPAGTWTDDGSGDLVVANSAAIATLTAFGIASDHETVSTGLTALVLGASSQFGVVDDRVDGSGVSCTQEFGIDGTTGARTEILVLDFEGHAILSDQPAAVAANQPLTVALRHDITAFDCDITNGSTTVDGSGTASIASGSAAIGMLMVGANATVEFQWLMVVANP